MINKSSPPRIPSNPTPGIGQQAVMGAATAVHIPFRDEEPIQGIDTHSIPAGYAVTAGTEPIQQYLDIDRVADQNAVLIFRFQQIKQLVGTRFCLSLGFCLAVIPEETLYRCHELPTPKRQLFFCIFICAHRHFVKQWFFYHLRIGKKQLCRQCGIFRRADIDRTTMRTDAFNFRCFNITI